MTSLSSMQLNGDLARLLLDYLDENQVSAESLRQHLIRYKPGSRMNFKQWWAYLEELQALMPTRAVGLELGLSIRPAYLGVLGYLTLSCATVGEALAQFERYQRLLHDGETGSASIEGGDVVVHWHTRYGATTLLSDEVLITGFLKSLRLVTGRDEVRPTAVGFTHPEPSNLSAYSRLLCDDVRFSQSELSFSFPAEYLNLPLSTADPDLHRLLQSQANALLNVLPQADSFYVAFQDALIKGMQTGKPNAAYIAEQLHVSERTLHRRLQEQQGKSFGSVLRETRLRLAKEYLGNRQLSLTEIAILLGYSEQSAFSRAFKQWQGETPRIYRERALKP